jgi:hypothetical protein
VRANERPTARENARVATRTGDLAAVGMDGYPAAVARIGKVENPGRIHQES